MMTEQETEDGKTQGLKEWILTILRTEGGMHMDALVDRAVAYNQIFRDPEQYVRSQEIMNHPEGVDYMQQVALANGVSGSFMYEPREDTRDAYEYGLAIWLADGQMVDRVKPHEISDPAVLRGFVYKLLSSGYGVPGYNVQFSGSLHIPIMSLGSVDPQYWDDQIQETMRHYHALGRCAPEFHEYRERFERGLQIGDKAVIKN